MDAAFIGELLPVFLNPRSGNVIAGYADFQASAATGCIDDFDLAAVLSLEMPKAMASPRPVPPAARLRED